MKKLKSDNEVLQWAFNALYNVVVNNEDRVIEAEQVIRALRHDDDDVLLVCRDQRMVFMRRGRSCAAYCVDGSFANEAKKILELMVIGEIISPEAALAFRDWDDARSKAKWLKQQKLELAAQARRLGFALVPLPKREKS